MNKAYIAGLFDGEGCVSFGKARSSIFIRALITNTDKQVLEDLQAVYGGDIRPLSKREENWKQGWQLRLSWSRAVTFLSDIPPWLRIKDKQATVAFAWDAIRPGSGKMSAKDSTDLAESYQLLQEYLAWLNFKGPHRGSNPLIAAMEA